MNNLKVVKIEAELIGFNDGTVLYSNHESDCCEHHWLSTEDLRLDDFDGLRFDLSTDDFFKRIPDYGIELIPTNGHSVKIPGYGSNNGYYSDNLSLIVENKETEVRRTYDITECQVANDY